MPVLGGPLFLNVFNLSQKTLSPSKTKVLEKGLGFSPTSSSINEVDVRIEISSFSRKMRCNWFFRNESGKC